MLDNELFLPGFIILMLFLLSAFFSAAETALTAISRPRVYRLVMDGNRAAKIVSKLRRYKESLIGTVLLGNTAVNVAASALATSLSIAMFGNEVQLVAIVTLVMTLFLVVFTEILPKTYAIQNPESVSLALAPTINVIVMVLYPITWSIRLFIRVLFRLFGIDIAKTNTLISTTDLIRGTIELHHREGKMIKQDRDMLGSILDLGDIEVKDIMIHRKQVETIEADLPAETLIAQALSSHHRRLPVWKDNPDNIVGLLHVKTIIKLLGKNQNRFSGNMSVAEVLSTCSKPWFIPETTTLRDQLIAFRHKRQHFAFVVDEYGGWQGVVTLEDIIEEIIGEIDDEHDEPDDDIRKLGEDAYLVNGDVTVRELNRELDWNLPDEHASTIAGLLIHEAQSIPSPGEHFDIYGFRFTVVAKDALQVTRLRIDRLPHTKLPEDVEV